MCAPTMRGDEDQCAWIKLTVNITTHIIINN